MSANALADGQLSALVGDMIEPVIVRRREMLGRLTDEQLSQLAEITRAMLNSEPVCPPLWNTRSRCVIRI
ncbi:MAG TPA: hypothetical protein VGT61_15780 [Thermomicrobiales bacterium]|nr:hypothetical protein [Thermomicrobiales bacterium]